MRSQQQRWVTAALLAMCCFSHAAQAQKIDTIAGNGKSADGGASGVAMAMPVGQPFGVEVGPDGALYICEVQNHRIRRVDLGTGQLTTIAGTGKSGYSGDGGPATDAAMNEPYELRFDSRGNIYVVEMKNHIVRRIDAASGRISTVAGTGQRGFGGDDGPAIAAQMNQPHSIALDGESLYIADIGNHRIRRVDLKLGTIETVAGNGQKALPIAGKQASGQPMLGPRALFIQGDTLYIALREGNSIWSMHLKSGVLKHLGGTGKKGYSGDGGLALAATFSGPKGIVANARGELFIVDTENQAIRRIDPAGTLTTLAGASASFRRPHGIAVAPDGTLYIGDSENHRVCRIRSD